MALLVGVVFGAGFVYVSNQEPEEDVLCALGFMLVEAGGVTGSLQDRSSPGPDDCDGPEVDGERNVLGFDCKFRSPEGVVLVELEPNRPDGTCGLAGNDSPFPPSWHTA